MATRNKVLRFVRYEGKILLVTLLLVLITGGFTWSTFYRTPPPPEIRRAYLIEDISRNLSIESVRLEKFDSAQLEIISRLDLNGLIALERYPLATVRVYHELQNFQLFYDIIDDFGPQHIIPVLDYFYEEDNVALIVEQKFSELVASIFNKPAPVDNLTARQKRLLMILNEIDYQKHNFLARFIFTDDGAERNYVATTTSTIVNFFTGGLSHFNEAAVTKGIAHVSTEELVDAGIDILVLVPLATFFMRSSRAAATAVKGGRVVSMGETALVQEGAQTMAKTGRFARMAQASKSVLRIIPLRTLFRFKYVKWYLLGLVVLKPELINHAASLVAQVVSVPPIVMKTGFWFIIFFPLLNLILPIFLFGRRLFRVFAKRKIAIAGEMM